MSRDELIEQVKVRKSEQQFHDDHMGSTSPMMLIWACLLFLLTRN
jgi:hypothetical protein